MKLNNLLKLRQVGGEYMIINPYSEAADMTQVISLNETAKHGCGNRSKKKSLPQTRW